jgi:hypothetical protein
MDLVTGIGGFNLLKLCPNQGTPGIRDMEEIAADPGQETRRRAMLFFSLTKTTEVKRFILMDEHRCRI